MMSFGSRDASSYHLGNAAINWNWLKRNEPWFQSIGNYIGVYNDSNPLLADNGEAVVWIRGYDTYLSCLGEELVRAGLVTVDLSNWNDYTFTVPTKEGEEPED